MSSKDNCSGSGMEIGPFDIPGNQSFTAQPAVSQASY